MSNENDVNTEWIARAKKLMVDYEVNTYLELANLTGISSATLNQLLRGKYAPRQKTLEKLAKALGVTVQYLMFGDGEEGTILPRIPILSSPAEVLSWSEGDKIDDREVEWLEVFDESVSNTGFAIRFNYDDMTPVFQRGDLLMFSLLGNQDLEELAIDHRDIHLLVIDPGVRWMFGRFEKTNTGNYLGVYNTRYRNVELKTHHRIIGICAHQIRTLFQRREGN